MKSLNEMRQLVHDKVAKVLTVERAKSLKGKKIQTIYFGYAHQDGTDEFIVGDIISRLELARMNENFSGYKNQAEYWESFMTKSRLEEARNTLCLLTDTGRDTYIFCWDGEHFCCSDSDRWVSYIESK